MKKSLTVLLLSAMLASGAGVFAQAPPAATTLSVRGTIDKYDASSRTLSLSTANGVVRLPLAATTRVRQAGRTVEAQALQKLTGDHATVRYTETDGNRVVESVHVFGK
jgi:type 1 fimbria pilin